MNETIIESEQGWYVELREIKEGIADTELRGENHKLGRGRMKERQTSFTDLKAECRDQIVTSRNDNNTGHGRCHRPQFRNSRQFEGVRNVVIVKRVALELHVVGVSLCRPLTK